MLSDIDNILFPDSCEVFDLDASQHLIMGIMKNGSSNFRFQISSNMKPNWRCLEQHEIPLIKQPLITFVRDPKQRFKSGVNTYIFHLLKDHPQLDVKTILWFVDNYLFLNRHYCPQFFWFVNLARFTGPDVVFDLKPMSAIRQYTDVDISDGVEPPSQEIIDAIETFNWTKLELYFFLDQVIVDCIEQRLTFRQIVDKIIKHPELKELVLDKTLNLSKLLNSCIAQDSTTLLD